jgi:L-alanine-DL-glutamate epimerase-like enolase superfamily enzyme
MVRKLAVAVESFPIDGLFTISRGAKTQADVILCEISQGDVTGRGECVPYKRYGETMDGVFGDIIALKQAIENGLSRDDLQHVMKPGAARNAVDCALWDLEAKLSGQSVASSIGLNPLNVLTTAYTLSLGEPEAMHAAALKNADRPLLKIKTGTPDDAERLRAVRAGAPRSAIIVDANEGWTEENLAYHLALAKECNIALIEQPLPAGADALLSTIDRIVPICADESVHSTEDLAKLRDRYDAINIKLDKTGGLTEALKMKAKAIELNYKIMVGCMVGTSLAMAPAILVAQGADFVDLDGPLLLAKDRSPSLTYQGSLLSAPDASLWG